MPSRSRNIRDSARGVARSAIDPLDRWRTLALGGLVALAVATPLLPSEAAPAKGTHVVVIMLWWVLLLGWFIAGILRGRLPLRGGAVAAALVAFVSWHSLAAWWMAPLGQPRAAWNLLWLWLSFAVCFFLARQLVRTAAECRAVVAVLMALAVGLSVHGYYQYFHSMPETRRAYLENPEKALAEAGVFAPPGSADRRQFEDRLRSTEPMATFILANSLAGFLSPWLLVTLGVAATSGSRSEIRWPVWIAAGVSATLISGCWVLTKSRSAWLATAIGLTLLGIAGWRAKWWRLNWRLVGGTLAAVGAGALFGFATGGLDRLVFTETFKSLSYRLQYWQAAWRMIRDYPWFGCGPGNFQQYYTAYKLPEASEEVADPHNFALEIWSTTGTPGLLLFALLAAVFVWQVWRAGRPVPVSQGPACAGDGVRAVYWGALAGVIVAYFPCGYLVGQIPDYAILAVCLPVAGAVLGTWTGWVRQGELRPTVLLLAIVTLLLNLLGAGGIGFAGVSLSLWLLAALALHTVEGERECPRIARKGLLALTITVLALAICCHQTEYDPVLRGSALLDRGNEELLQRRPDQAERTFLGAATADPWCDQPWLGLASLRHQKWLAAPNDPKLEEFQTAARKMLELNQRSSTAFFQYGDWLMTCYLKTNDAVHLGAAIEMYGKAVGLYPNDAFGRAQLAWCLHQAGRQGGAARQAEAALELDKRNPHVERKLFMHRILGSPPATATDARNAEQLMEQLRIANSPRGPISGS